MRYTADGVSYFSAAGNEGPDSGYLSTFRTCTGTVTGIGSGTFMNFAPSGATNFLLPDHNRDRQREHHF